MGIRHKHFWSVFFGICIAVAFLSLPVGLITLDIYGTRMYQSNMEMQEEQLLRLAHSTDASVERLIARLRTELSYMVTQGSVAALEVEGDISSAELQKVLDDNLTAVDHLADVIIASREGVQFASSSGGVGMTFSFPYNDTSDNIRIAISDDGGNYIAFIQKSEISGLEYAALIELQTFYEDIVGEEITDVDWVVLYDADCDFFLQNDEAQSAYITLPREEALNREDGYSLIARGADGVEPLTGSYSYVDNGTEGDAHMVVLPVAVCRNGVFTVAIAGQDPNRGSWVSDNTIGLIMAVGMIVIGLAALIFIVVHLTLKRKDAERELAILESKNRAAEELLANYNELARHQRLESVGVMVSSIVHEFNNLLTPIMGYSVMALNALPEKDDAWTEEIAEYAAEIYASSDQAKKLIGKLRNFTKTSKKQEMVPLSPDEILEDTWRIMGPVRKAQVKITSDYNVPEKCILGDHVQLSQLFLNLILNAFHAMENMRGATLLVRTSRENGKVTVMIADNGIGMTTEVEKHLFEAFYTTNPETGTGMGMAIVQEVATLHNAEITHKSEEGKGTTFWVTFQEKEEKTEDNPPS